MDAIGKGLLQRVGDLLAARQDVSRAEFGRRIARGHSWTSEFFAGLRTTNDLRLVMKMARVFDVSAGYLLGETDDALDPGAATLLAAWHVSDSADRDLLLTIAASLRRRAGEPADPGDAPPAPGSSEARGRTRARADEPPKRKR